MCVLPAQNVSERGFKPDHRLDACAGWIGSSHAWILHEADRHFWLMLGNNGTRDPAFPLKQVDQAPHAEDPYSALVDARQRLFLKLWPQPALLDPAFGIGVTHWPEAPRAVRVAAWLLTLPLQLRATTVAFLIAPPSQAPRRATSATNQAEKAARRIAWLQTRSIAQ